MLVGGGAFAGSGFGVATATGLGGAASTGFDGATAGGWMTIAPGVGARAVGAPVSVNDGRAAAGGGATFPVATIAGLAEAAPSEAGGGEVLVIGSSGGGSSFSTTGFCPFWF